MELNKKVASSNLSFVSLSIPKDPKPVSQAHSSDPVCTRLHGARAEPFSVAHNEPYPLPCKLVIVSLSPWELQLFKQAADLPHELLQHV